jgi:hypothetical protein
MLCVRHAVETSVISAKLSYFGLKLTSALASKATAGARQGREKTATEAAKNPLHAEAQMRCASLKTATRRLETSEKICHGRPQGGAGRVFHARMAFLRAQSPKKHHLAA